MRDSNFLGLEYPVRFLQDLASQNVCIITFMRPMLTYFSLSPLV